MSVLILSLLHSYPPVLSPPFATSAINFRRCSSICCTYLFYLGLSLVSVTFFRSLHRMIQIVSLKYFSFQDHHSIPSQIVVLFQPDIVYHWNSRDFSHSSDFWMPDPVSIRGYVRSVDLTSLYAIVKSMTHQVERMDCWSVRNFWSSELYFFSILFCRPYCTHWVYLFVICSVSQSVSWNQTSV